MPSPTESPTIGFPDILASSTQGCGVSRIRYTILRVHPLAVVPSGWSNTESESLTGGQERDLYRKATETSPLDGVVVGEGSDNKINSIDFTKDSRLSRQFDSTNPFDKRKTGSCPRWTKTKSARFPMFRLMQVDLRAVAGLAGWTPVVRPLNKKMWQCSLLLFGRYLMSNDSSDLFLHYGPTRIWRLNLYRREGETSMDEFKWIEINECSF